MKLKKLTFIAIIGLLSFNSVSAQEDNPILPYKVAPQNLLKYNRFLINPTFSTVREDKSYINLLHRNQSVQFEDNAQTYFLSYSGRVGDKSGLGLSLYNQKVGPLSNIGVLANYAYGVKLSDKSNFTFGANLAYYSTGLNRNSVTVVDADDYRINGTEDSNVLSFQPGFNLSYGSFDFGAYAENLFDYNLKNSESLTDFADKTYSAHLQYTHQFQNSTGVLESARLMPLARVKMEGKEDVNFGGSLILDLPKIGWLQGGYDSFYGASAGIGFNLNQRLSLGYTMEKGFTNDFDNLGVTHEISFAYSFTPNLTEDRVMLEDDYNDLASNAEVTPKELLTKDEEIEELKRKLAENDDILAELMFRQDSIESNRDSDLERRFDMVMRMVKRETQGNRPDLEEKAKKIYFINNDATETIANANTPKDVVPSVKEETLAREQAKDAIATTNTSIEKAVVEQSKPKDAIAVVDKKPTVIKPNTASKADITSSEKTIAAIDKVAQRSTSSGNTRAIASRNTSKDKIPAEAFERAAKKNNIKSRRFTNLEGVADGYYIVANVYKGQHYLNKFVDKLNQDGVQADYFTNPNNDLKYVYLKRYDSWQDALEAHKSSVDGTYTGDLWVMNVDNGKTTTDSRYNNTAYASNVTKIKDKVGSYDTNVLQKNVIVKTQETAVTPLAQTYNIDGIGSGFYIIVNVFANPKNANRFVKLLNSNGLNASYFINPKNNYRYVYLKKHNTWNNALISYYTKLNDRYDDKMWIMRVKPTQLT